MSPALHIGTSPGRQFRTSPGWSNRIFTGRPGDIGGRRLRDVLGVNICRLCIDSSKEINNKDPKFKIGDFVRISKCKNIFAKGYTPRKFEKVFVIKKDKNSVPWTYFINDHNGEEIVATFYEKELQKKKSKKFRIEKLIRKKAINYMSNGKDTIIRLIVG